MKLGVMIGEILWLLLSLLHPLLSFSSDQEQINGECQASLQIKELAQSLDSALQFLEQVKKEGGWGKIGLSKKSLEKGDSGKVILSLRSRMNKQGIHVMDTGRVFDESLASAIKKFQCLHGLLADGKVGRETVYELNVSIEQRISMIRANQERVSRISRFDHERLALINIPSFRVYVFEGGKMVFSSKVVVGKNNTQTAEFGAEMNAVILNPYWEIPNSILSKEILPDMKKDPSYLERNHMEWSGDRLRQRPGPDNALGMIKFLFPNPYHIYLHDTPSKELFTKEKRAFSHGCIRVADPMKLAVFALAGTEWEDSTAIQASLLRESDKRISIDKKIHVEVTYLTAFVDGNGDLNFRRDLYQKQLKTVKMPKKS
jgi:murein L,D-transpeptidase YcbB/YkuD